MIHCVASSIAVSVLLLAPQAKPRQTPAADIRGTERAPAIVKLLPAEKRPDELRADSIERAEHLANEAKTATATERLFWITVVLAIGTGVLAVFTVKLWIETERLATDSSKHARREFVAAFRPKIKVRQVARRVRDGENIVEFVVTNAGGSAARIVDSRVVVVMRARGKPLPIRPFDDAAPFLSNLSLEPGEAINAEWIEAGDQYTVSMADAFEKETDLFILGYLLYEDEIHTRRRTAFCRRFDRDTERFRELGDPDYEYAD